MRRGLHARIVEALEALAGDRVAEQVDRLAHHALRGEVWDKALAYLRQAGEKAMARSAYREAVGYFEQVLGVLPHLPEQRTTHEQAIGLRLALFSALRPLGDFGRILTALRQAEALAATLDDPRRLAQVSLIPSGHFRFMGAHDQAIAAGQHTLALATAGRDEVLHARANQYLGYAYHALGDYLRAIDCLGQTPEEKLHKLEEALARTRPVPLSGKVCWKQLVSSSCGRRPQGVAVSRPTQTSSISVSSAMRARSTA